MRAVEVRVVNQPFPAYGGARFFKIGAHHNQQFFGVFLAQGQQALRVFQRGFGVVNGARPDNHEQAVIFAVQDVGDLLARLGYQLGGLFADGQFV